MIMKNLKFILFLLLLGIGFCFVYFGAVICDDTEASIEQYMMALHLEYSKDAVIEFFETNGSWFDQSWVAKVKVTKVYAETVTKRFQECKQGEDSRNRVEIVSSLSESFAQRKPKHLLFEGVYFPNPNTRLTLAVEKVDDISSILYIGYDLYY